MSNDKSQPKKVITESGISNDGVNRSNQVSKGEALASPEDMVLALEKSNEAIEALKLENERLRKEAESKQGSDNNINILAQAILQASKASAAVVQGPTEADEVNKSTDFKNTKAMVDGRSLMEQQQILQQFRSENKKPISIPKSFQSSIGPQLVVTVNGIRVSIPCDGKTYFINETHWEHARERMAKVDILNTMPEDNDVVITS